MEIIPLLMKEMETEAALTNKMLERVPSDKYTWKPHEKSMSMHDLATHIADIPSWVHMALNTSELDFATMNYTPVPVASTEELVARHKTSVEKGLQALRDAKEEDLLPSWTMRSGEQIFAVMTKYEVIRHAFAQIIHHRAQLGVYLRLLNTPIPGTYGPSADDMSFA